MNIKQLFDAANAVAPLVPYGGAAVVAAKAITQLIDEVGSTKPAADGVDPAMLSKERDALEAAVNAHADRTLSSLG